MAIPIPYFSYAKEGLTVNFNDLSLNTPTSWAWDFGDSNSSTEKNPSHTYSEKGFYVVTFTPSNSDGSPTAFTLQIGISADVDILNQSLIQTVYQILPSVLIPTVDVSEIFSQIEKWQTYLRPKVYTPIKVSEEDVHNEFAWPGMVNRLIAELTARDLLLILAERGISNILTGMSSSDGASSSSPSDGGVKKITTGPAEVEFTSDEEKTKALKDILSGKDGALEKIKISSCSIARHLDINIPGYCEELAKPVIVPDVITRYKGKGLSERYYPILGSSDFYNLLFGNTQSQIVTPDETRIDNQQSDYYYYGYYYEIDDSYTIVRILISNLDNQDSFSSGPNPVMTFDSAWTNRITLTYS